MNQNLLYQLVERIGNFLRVEQRLAGKAFGLQEVHLQVLLYLSLCNRYRSIVLFLSIVAYRKSRVQQ